MTNTMQVSKNRSGYGFENVVDNIFNNTMRRFFDGNLWDAESGTNTGKVPVNVREKEDRYEVDVIAPGCRKENFSIQIRDNELVISLRQNDEKSEQDEKAGWVRNEYMLKTFSRAFTLDHTIDVEKITAKYEDGILQIVLPKNEKARPVSIAIDVK